MTVIRGHQHQRDRTWRELQAALLDEAPECRNDDRFVGDSTHGVDLLPICEPCPVFFECLAYAREAKPEGGIWAGRRWTNPHPTTNTNRRTA